MVLVHANLVSYPQVYSSMFLDAFVFKAQASFCLLDTSCSRALVLNYRSTGNMLISNCAIIPWSCGDKSKARTGWNVSQISGFPYQRCRWGCRPAGSLAQLSPGEVVLGSFLSYSVRCVAEAARCQLDQFERSTLWFVPRFANFVAMSGQFVETPCFVPMLRAIVTAVSLTKFGNIERPNMWNTQLQMVGLAQVICKRSGNSNHHFDLFYYWAIIRCSTEPDCWHARHLQKPRCMMQAWEENTEPHSQNRGGSEKWSLAALERQKCLRCAAEKNMPCRGVSKHLRFPPPKSCLSVKQSKRKRFKANCQYICHYVNIVFYDVSTLARSQNRSNQTHVTVDERLNSMFCSTSHRIVSPVVN